MGRKGNKSRRGVGEKDSSVRNRRIYVWVTEEDVIRLNNAVKKLGIEKPELLIRLLRILFDTVEGDSE